MDSSALLQMCESNILNLKKSSGDNYKGTCPSGNHNDRNPSWSINIHTSEHHCFSCGFKGNGVTLANHLGLDPKPFYTDDYKHNQTLKNGHIKTNNVYPIQVNNQSNLQDKKVRNRPLKEPKKTIAKYYDINVKYPSIMPPNWSSNALKSLEIKYSEKYKHFVFPIHNEQGQWVNLWFHKPTKKFMKKEKIGYDYHHQLYPMHLIPDYDKKEPTFITEGMKDVVTLLSWGYQAVSSTGGGSIPTDISILKDFNLLYIVTDNDESGIRYRNRLCPKLKSLTKKSIHFTDWTKLKKKHPIKSDVSDITFDEFIALASTSEEYVSTSTNIQEYNSTNKKKGFKTMSIQEFMANDLGEVEVIIEELLVEKGILLIAGLDGVGKSLIANNTALCLATGTDLFQGKGEGLKVKKKKVLYLQFEVKDKETQSRLRKQLKAFNLEDADFTMVPRDQLKDEFEDKWEQLEQTLKDLSFTDGVVVVDNLYTSTDAEVSDNDSLKGMLRTIGRLTREYDCSFILIGHFTKGAKNSSTLDKIDIQGGKKLTDFVDNILLVGQSIPVDELRIGKIAKVRSGKSYLQKIPFKLKMDENLIFYKFGIIDNEEAHLKGSIKSKEIEVLKTMKPIPRVLNTDKEIFTTEQYRQALTKYKGYEQIERTAYNHIEKLIKYGVVKKIKKNQYEPLWETLEDSL